MNGANDNASGTTALLMLAAQFGENPVGEKNIVFAAFSGEELGLFGSEYMAGERDRPSITAMLNLEMLGIPQFGVLLFFATGNGVDQIVDMNSPFLFRPVQWGFGLPVVYLIWLIVVASLYLPCRWFAGVKSRRRDWWLSYL